MIPNLKQFDRLLGSVVSPTLEGGGEKGLLEWVGINWLFNEGVRPAHTIGIL